MREKISSKKVIEIPILILMMISILIIGMIGITKNLKESKTINSVSYTNADFMAEVERDEKVTTENFAVTSKRTAITNLTEVASSNNVTETFKEENNNSNENESESTEDNVALDISDDLVTDGIEILVIDNAESTDTNTATSGVVTSINCSGYSSSTYYKSLTLTVYVNGTSLITPPYAPKNLQYEWTTSTSTPSSYTNSVSYSSLDSSKIAYSGVSSNNATTGKNYLHVKYTAYDESYSVTTYFGPILFDKTKPTAGYITMKLGDPTGETYTGATWTSKSVYLSLSQGSDGYSGHKSTTYTVNGGSAQSANSYITSSGTHTIVVTTTDNAGNTATRSSSAKVDKTAPATPTITNSSGGSWTNKSVTITAKSSDSHSGLENVQYRLGTSGSWQDFYSFDTSTGTASGSFSSNYNSTLYIKAVDNVGNESTASTTLKIDKTAPTAGTMTMKLGSSTGSTYTSDTWTNQSVYISPNNGSDALSGHKSTTYTVDGKSYTGAQTLTEDGTHTIVVTTTDNAGNTATNTYIVKIDKAAPIAGTMTMKLGSSTGGTYTSDKWTNQSVYISPNNGSDALSGHKSTTYTVDGKSYTGAQTLTEDGTHTIVVTTTDNAGNTATNTYIVKIDKAAPTAGTMTMKLESSTGNTYTSDTWTNQNVYISPNNGSDVLSGHKSTTYTVDGKSYTGEQILTEDGTYTIVVTTTDNAENTATNSYIIKIRRVESIEITNYPTKMKYNAYEEFDETGMEITIRYYNGNTEKTTNYTVINKENLTCQVKELEIQYNENPEIKTKLQGIEVGHAEAIDKRVEPTCTETGVTEGKHCEVCHTVLVAQEDILPLGHSFTNYVSNDDATCTEDGTKTAKCDRCDETHTIVDEGSKKGHNYSEKVTVPTCTEKGYTTHTCTRCGDSYVDSHTEPLGHSFTNYVSNDDATCTEDGTKTAKCDRCDETHTIVDEGSKRAHNYEDGICTNCGAELALEIGSDKYNINNLYITGVQAKTTVKEFKANIKTK